MRRRVPSFVIGPLRAGVRVLLALTLLLGLAGQAPREPGPSAAAWDRVLRAHARGGRLDYGGLRADAARMRDLDAFLAEVRTMNEDAPLAAWLDAYNALVVKSVLARLPIASVRDVPGFFDRARHRVAGEDRTLDEIENRVIRRRFRDARVHVALSCAALGCPPLHGRAFGASDLDATLDRLARAVVASDRYVVRTGDGLRISEIFFWYREDFERDAGSIVAWLARYDARGRLAGVGEEPRLERIPYDWRLNDRDRARR
jgi:hypothetical protein